MCVNVMYTMYIGVYVNIMYINCICERYVYNVYKSICENYVYKLYMCERYVYNVYKCIRKHYVYNLYVCERYVYNVYKNICEHYVYKLYMCERSVYNVYKYICEHQIFTQRPRNGRINYVTVKYKSSAKQGEQASNIYAITCKQVIYNGTKIYVYNNGVNVCVCVCVPLCMHAFVHACDSWEKERKVYLSLYTCMFSMHALRTSIYLNI